VNQYCLKLITLDADKNSLIFLFTEMRDAKQQCIANLYFQPAKIGS